MQVTFTFFQPQNPCKKTQHWVENAEGPPQCIDCQACPPGQTISPECGNSKPLTPNTTVFCVPCQLGKSFSSEYSISVCIPCSSCSKDQVVIKNCTRQADIKCGKKCYSKDRYIMKQLYLKWLRGEGRCQGVLGITIPTQNLINCRIFLVWF